jgi:ATP-dependent clp protease adaptor protein clpS
MKRQRKYNIYCESSQTEKQTDVLLLEEENAENKLVLYNDDVNTFDFVIESLIEVCKHTLEQAEQCTMLVHYKGKCTVKTGDMETLMLMHQKLLGRGLTSEII